MIPFAYLLKIFVLLTQWLESLAPETNNKRWWTVEYCFLTGLSKITYFCCLNLFCLMSIFKILHSYITLMQCYTCFSLTKIIICWQKFCTFGDAETASLGTVFSTAAVCLLRVSFSDSRIAILSFRLIRWFFFVFICDDIRCFLDYVMISDSNFKSADKTVPV